MSQHDAVPEQPRLVTARFLAALLQVSARTILEWFRDGRIPGVKASRGTVRFDLAEVLAALKAAPATRRQDIAHYEDAQDHVCIEGYAQPAPNSPHCIMAFGTIGNQVQSAADRPVVVDVRAIVGKPRRVAPYSGKGWERCELTLALSDGRTIRIGLDATLESVEAAIRMVQP
jgi:excisionase family DNA binding protein